MKKTTAFFLSIGVMTMIIGGIGSGVYFKRAEKSMTDTKKQSYEIKNKENTKEIHLTLSGNADFYILTEPTDKIVMNTRSSAPISLNSSLDVKETNDQLMVSANSAKNKTEFEGLNFDLFNRGAAVTLTIPESAEHLIIDGNAKGRINLSNITTKDLSIKLNDADLDVNNINADKLAIETTHGDLNVYADVHTDKATFTTKNGDILISEFTASNWTATSSSGDISLNTVNGSAKIDTINGDIQATDLKGEIEAKSTNGDFSLYGTEIPKKLTVNSQQGDINLHTEEILYDVAIKTKTKLGDSTIYGKDSSSYKRGKGSKTFDLQTKSGDISVEGPSDFENEEDE
ncbi:DUF4097 family beta strand repeat-containing protein [Enterococcus quebecensis]|uniref:DUF4097 domain-containing protein n=1 Tax=Enterococcus quebecensis TaxID=903983 RepID=A0A1E5H059_9ENTE|nr:DUF4097 family beta strand repeat-containing protein [Enterococcus quebecensis]OEG18331.1 hypothetical protein BCR23_13955 [Enterococcus quebecensis]OJG72511.1 hypothetical protein RV12_GL000925 [Enterococcus quebecensis]